MVIIHTTVWIDYFRNIDNPETNWLSEQLQQQRLGLTDLILCEVLQGIRDQKTFERLRGELLRFQFFSTGGAELAVAAAGNYRTLRQRGHTVRKTIDCLIATFCLRNHYALLHRDRDYDAFETLGLEVIHV